MAQRDPLVHQLAHARRADATVLERQMRGRAPGAVDERQRPRLAQVPQALHQAGQAEDVEIAGEQQWELHFSEISQHDLIVDAIFGAGFRGRLARRRGHRAGRSGEAVGGRHGRQRALR